MNTDSNQKRANNLEREVLNTSSKINEHIYSDPSVMFSSAEACTPLITYNELEQATNYWNKENILGKGGFGVVFKGIWKNTAVAIKRLESQVIIHLIIPTTKLGLSYFILFKLGKQFSYYFHRKNLVTPQ